VSTPWGAFHGGERWDLPPKKLDRFEVEDFPGPPFASTLEGTDIVRESLSETEGAKGTPSQKNSAQTCTEEAWEAAPGPAT